MPGSQELLLGRRLGKYELLVTVRPESRWRHLKLIGSLVLFRLGANIKFRVDIKTVEIGPDDPPWTDFVTMDDSERLELFLNGRFYSGKAVKFQVPDEVGKKVYLTTESYFLQVVGDAELRPAVGSGPPYALYAFRVWEPALSVVNWGMALLAGGFGAVIVWAIGALTGNDITPPTAPIGGDR